MKILGLEVRRTAPVEQRSVEGPTISVSDDSFFAFFGMQPANIPHVTIDRALTVPAFSAGVGFLSRCLATLPLHLYRKADAGPEKQAGGLQTLIHEAPNPETTSFEWRRYMWQQVFTGGRGLTWIERSGSNIVALWPMDPKKSKVRRVNGQRFYDFDGKTYPAGDVIDVPFMLREDQLRHWGPVTLGAKALAQAIAMSDYATNFFAGGGVPPLALEGPLPQGADAQKRALADIQRAIKQARDANSPFFGMPPGHSLKPIAFEPDKSQATQIKQAVDVEIARLLGLPPVFIQDLTHGTFTNTEQQDIQLAKHVLTHWSACFEQELNLKLFGQRNGNRYVEHNLDGIQRGDFLSRSEGTARAIFSGQLTPNEARAMDNRPAKDGGDELLIQGATIPLLANTTEPGLRTATAGGTKA